MIKRLAFFIMMATYCLPKTLAAGADQLLGPNAVVPEVTSCPLKIPVVQAWYGSILSPNMAFYVENRTNYNYELAYEAQFDTDAGPMLDRGPDLPLTAIPQAKAWVQFSSTKFYASYGNFQGNEHPRLTRIKITCSKSSNGSASQSHPSFWEARSQPVLQQQTCPFTASQARLWNGDGQHYISLYVKNPSREEVYLTYAIEYTDRDGFSNTAHESIFSNLTPQSEGWYVNKTDVDPTMRVDKIIVGCR